MKYLPILLLFLCSCTTHKAITKENSNHELLKELAYCKCMGHAIERFSKKDTADISSGLVVEEMDYHGLYDKIVSPILDSAAKVVVIIEAQHQFSAGRHESANGKTTYILSCLEFYKSKQLDSLVKSFDPRTYIIKYN